jgi:hypothetical protein
VLCDVSSHKFVHHILALAAIEHIIVVPGDDKQRIGKREIIAIEDVVSRPAQQDVGPMLAAQPIVPVAAKAGQKKVSGFIQDPNATPLPE